MNYYNEFDPNAAEWLRELIKMKLIPDGVIDERSITDVGADDVRGFTQCHFFAGVSGWALALRLAGWPEDKPVWTGSCPCQPFSSAGKRKAFADDRDLWPQFFRLIKECKPQYVCGEQVASSEIVGTELETAFLVAVQNGDYAKANKLAKRLASSNSFHYHRRWLDRVYADLETAGYAGRPEVLGAHSVGAPHIRQRLYWGAARVADNNGSGLREQRRSEPVPQGHNTSEYVGLQSVSPWSDFALIYCRDNKVRRVPAESLLQRVADGVSEGMDVGGNYRIPEPEKGFPLCKDVAGRVMLLKGFGNAIAPYLAAEFIKASSDAERAGK